MFFFLFFSFLFFSCLINISITFLYITYIGIINSLLFMLILILMGLLNSHSYFHSYSYWKCNISGSAAYGICCQLTWVHVVDTKVETSGFSGIFAAYGGNVQVIGERSRVWGNCRQGRPFDYGCRVHGKGSKVICMPPLQKEKVAIGNLGGGNLGAT